MPMQGRALARTLACVLVVVTAARCGGGAPPPESPAPQSPPSTAGNPTATEQESLEHDPVHDQSFARIEDLIEGRASGVQVIRRPDGGISLRIRGISSPSGSNEPLLIIDGISIQPSQVGQALLSLHPQDVVRISVLKDAASTAFYGMRGANGVLVITTRRQ